MANFVYILFLCILDQIRVELVGSISALDVFVLLYTWLYIMKNRGLGVFRRDTDIVRLSKYFLVLILVQTVSELIVDNTVQNALKGIAVTLMCYVKFLFILGLFFKSKSNIVYYLLGTLIANILFFRVNDLFGFGEMDVDVENMKTGEGLAMAYFKFKISPLINSAAILLSVLMGKSTTKVAIAFIAIGVVTIVLGARSSGLILLVSGAIPLLIYENIKWNRKKITLACIVVVAVGTYSYRMYIDKVLSGAINSGNTHAQISKMNNPYNLLELLKYGRTESMVGLTAFADSPVVGWGAWPKDPGLRYNSMLFDIQDTKQNKRIEADIIPTHSVVVGYGVYNGALAMLMAVVILAFFVKRGVLALRHQSIFAFILSSSLVGLIWDGLFSPISSMRFQFVLYFACIYYVYKMMQYPILSRRYGYIKDSK